MKLIKNIFRKKSPNNNAMFTLQPYRHHGCWVFDDPTRGLVAEAFVCGMSEIIDAMLEASDLATDGSDKERLTFSPSKFPNSTHSLTWQHPENGGNWYVCDQTEQAGWLCPALFLFFPKAPSRLHARVDKIN